MTYIAFTAIAYLSFKLVQLRSARQYGYVQAARRK